MRCLRIMTTNDVILSDCFEMMIIIIIFNKVVYV